MLKKLKIILCMLLISVFLFPATVLAKADKLNIVLVLDISDSMKNTERPYRVEEAVRKFVGRMPVNGSVLSIVAFTGSYDIIADNYMFNSEQDKTNFADKLNELNERIDYYKNFNDGLNGTSVAKAMKQGDKLLASHKDSGEYLTAMLLYTDGINSRSAPDDEEQVIEAFEQGQYGGYPIYVVQMKTSNANASKGEKELDLSNLSNNNGGRWIQELNVNNIPFHFDSIAEQLADAVYPVQPIETVTETQDQTSTPAEQVTKPVVSISNVEIAIAPEDGMFDDEELVVQGTLKTINGNNINALGDEEIYQAYNAKFYIKNETDPDYRVTDMDVKGGSYKTRYQLPQGKYSFYIEVLQDNTSIQKSLSRTITVFNSVAPNQVFLEISKEGNIYQDKPGEDGAEVTFLAKLEDSVYNDPFYYNGYSATLLVEYNGNLIERLPMKVENQSYTSEYKITKSGEYVFQAELLIDANTGTRTPSTVKIVTYKKSPSLFFLGFELFLSFAIVVAIFIFRDKFFPHIYMGSLQYDITDIYGSSAASDTVPLKSYFGKLTLADILGSNRTKLFNSEWLADVEIKPVSKGINVKVKRNIDAELNTAIKTIRKKRLLLQNGDLLTLRSGDYKTIIKYSVY